MKSISVRSPFEAEVLFERLMDSDHELRLTTGEFEDGTLAVRFGTDNEYFVLKPVDYVNENS
ncbi:hypothetical protein BH11PAT2_BH11PAT2_04760 [soil metagenome]